jgi:hypothetical protein
MGYPGAAVDHGGMLRLEDIEHTMARMLHEDPQLARHIYTGHKLLADWTQNADVDTRVERDRALRRQQVHVRRRRRVAR